MKAVHKRIKKRINNKHGFTLAETLIAVLILLMVATVVATGIPAAANSYRKVVIASNAEVLLSTTIAKLRNELGTAEIMSVNPNPDEDPSKPIVYYHPDEGTTSKIYLGKDAASTNLADRNYDMIMFERYANYNKEDKTAKRFISELTSTEGLYVVYEDVSYSDNVITFTNLDVKKGEQTLASNPTLKIRVI